MAGFNKRPLKDSKQQQTSKSKKRGPARSLKTRGLYLHSKGTVVEINCLALFNLASSLAVFD